MLGLLFNYNRDRDDILIILKCESGLRTAHLIYDPGDTEGRKSFEDRKRQILSFINGFSNKGHLGTC